MAFVAGACEGVLLGMAHGFQVDYDRLPLTHQSILTLILDETQLIVGNDDFAVLVHVEEVLGHGGEHAFIVGRGAGSIELGLLPVCAVHSRASLLGTV